MGPSACQSLPPQEPQDSHCSPGLRSHNSRGALGLRTSRLVPALAPLPNLGDKLNLFLLPSCLPLFPDWERSLLQTRSFWQPSSRKSPRESKSEPTSGDSWVSITMLSQRVKLRVESSPEAPTGSWDHPVVPAPHLPSVRACLCRSVTSSISSGRWACFPLFKVRLRAVRKPAAQDWGSGAPGRRARARSCHPCARKRFPGARAPRTRPSALGPRLPELRPRVGSGSGEIPAPGEA